LFLYALEDDLPKPLNALPNAGILALPIPRNVQFLKLGIVG
jgi:hypothetical protein